MDIRNYKLCMRILENRGFDTPEKIDSLMYEDLGGLIEKTSFLDTDKAVEILCRAIKNSESVAVYYDYDADGIMGCSVAAECLRHLGLEVYIYANTRVNGGYGMQAAGVDAILSAHPDTSIILTVDNGISAIEGVEYAKSLGLKVIVTDHHEPGEVLPDADAVVNPKRRDDGCSFRDYCGAAVMFFLMAALYRELDKNLEPVTNTADFVAVATVADMVPILGGNRVLVKSGLTLINERRRLAFNLLAEMCKVKAVTAHSTIGYTYAPMINAPGRLDRSIDFIVEAFLSNNEEEIQACISEMILLNTERKNQTEVQVRAALNEVYSIISETDLPPVIVIYSSHFDEGIVGLIAGRILNRFNRPCVVFCDSSDGDILKASCRSIEAFPINEVLELLSPLLTNHGGHKMAAGLSMPKDNFEIFKRELEGLGKKLLTRDDFKPARTADLTVTPADLTVDEVEALSLLEPYGEGFRQPVFELIGFNGTNISRFGADLQHFKLRSDGLEVIFWNDFGVALQGAASKKFIGTPNVNRWRDSIIISFHVNNSYMPYASTFLQCLNGEFVEASNLDSESVSILYGGKTYSRPLSALGVSLLPFDVEKALAEDPAKKDLITCNRCASFTKKECLGRTQSICEHFK